MKRAILYIHGKGGSCTEAEQYRKNQLMKKIYGEGSGALKKLQEYHEQSLPVWIMKAAAE